MARRLKVIVCRGPDCGDRRGSAETHRSFVQQLREQPLPDAEVDIAWHSCFGQCANGPNVLVREVFAGENTGLINLMPTIARGAVLYHRVVPQEVPRVIHEHLKSGRILTDLTRKTEPDR